MSTYKEIKGFKVQTLASDTAASVASTGTWASAANANKAREEMGAGGTATAAIVFGGSGPPSDSPRTRGETEIFNGSSWTEVGDLPTVQKNQAGAGTSTSALSSAGQDPANTNAGIVQSWNGSSWTEVAEVNTARRQLCGMGASNTAALITMGYTTTRVTLTESWNGSAWTEVGDANTGRLRAGSFGSYTSGIVGGGEPASGGGGASSESWNGSAWTETNDLNTARKDLSSHGSGTSNTDGLIMAGYTTTNVANTESWDGSSWTELADLSTAFRNGFGSQQGSSSSAIAGIGFSSTYGVQTELWTTTPAANFTKTNLGQVYFNSGSNAFKVTEQPVPGGSWATGGTLNTGHGYGTGFGLQTAALSAFGGYPTHIADTELYNGTAWTEVNNGNTARRNLGSFGVQGSGLAFSGGPPFGSTTLTESWDGTSWTEVSDLPAGVYDNRGIGTSSSSGLSIGGDPGTVTTVNEWDGSSWGSFTALNTGRSQLMTSNAGSVTAGLVWGGETPSLTANTELWNGSSWTEVNNLNTARGNAGFNGISTAALTFGGNPGSSPSQSAICEYWNGTSWTEVNDLGTGINGGIAPAGGATSGLSSGGTSAPNTQNTGTEEWTVPEANSTITVS